MGTVVVPGWYCIIDIFDITRQREERQQESQTIFKQLQSEWSISFIAFLYPQETQMFHFPNPDELPFLISSASPTDEQKEILSIVFHIFPTTSQVLY